jgi:hypothetical protein
VVASSCPPGNCSYLHHRINGGVRRVTVQPSRLSGFQVLDVSSPIRTRPQVGTTKDTREAKNRVGDGLAVIRAVPGNRSVQIERRPRSEAL